MRWLAVHLPLLALEWNYPTAVPRALLDKQARRIVLANRAAKDQGVEPGIALATALSLCSELHTELIDEHAAAEALQSLALELGRWSARISCVDQTTLLAEVASMRRYFKGLKPLISAVRQMLTEQSLTYQLGFAKTPRAALALAWSNQPPQYDEVRIDQQIDALPLYALKLIEKDLSALASLGVESVVAVEQLPRRELGSRFNPDLLLKLDQLRGRIDWIPAPFIPPEQFSERVDLQAEINYAQGLLFPLQRLLGRLEGFLQLRQQYALDLEIELKHRDLSTATLALGHAGGCYQAQEWLALLRLKLERYRLAHPVIELALSVTRFRDWDAPAQDLFNPVKSDESPDQLLSRIEIRLGRRSISSLVVPETHLPTLDVAGLKVDRLLDRLPPDQRPLWLLDQPEALSEERLSTLSFIAGPERIQTQWWQRSELRDYFKVNWPDGRLAWIFRNQYQRWFLHGWFS